MTRHNTGPGQIEDKTNSSFLIARLYNFDTDWHELKPDHIKWLDNVAVPRMRKASGLYVVGLASRLGPPDYNLRLSKRRKDAVVNYLSGRTSSRVPTQSGWSGEANAHGPLEDDPYDRAVIISIYPAFQLPLPHIPKPHPPPRPPLIPQPLPSICTSTRFRMRMIQAGSFIVTMHAVFEIDDVVCHERQTYFFKGIGPPLPGLPYSWSGTGPWNSFTTSQAVTVHDFNGLAEIDSITNPPGKGPNYTLIDLHPARTLPINFRDFKTGRSGGVGLSAFMGDFIKR